MSAADFLFSPEVQTLLKIVFAAPGQQFSSGELARYSRLDAADVTRTLEHLVKSGILTQQDPKAEAPDNVKANDAFIFYGELRRIALKSFAAAEPIRAMLRSKFKDSVLRAFVLNEDKDGTVELLVVHGELTPDEAAMTAACQKLSKTLRRHLTVHVISNARFNGMTLRDALASKLAAESAFEIIALGDTKARLPVERMGLLQSAKKKLAKLSRSSA